MGLGHLGPDPGRHHRRPARAATARRRLAGAALRAGDAARCWSSTAPRTRSGPAAIGRRLAELTGGDLMLLEGVGHGPPAREPVRVNHLIKEFADLVHPPSTRRTRTWVRAQRPPQAGALPLLADRPRPRPPRPRDRRRAARAAPRPPGRLARPGPGHPRARRRRRAVHPASRWLANESAHIEDECAEHDLHAFQAIRRMDEILVNNFMVFNEVVEETHYDLVIGDEAWDVDYFLHENPELKRFAFAWMTDFVGWLPMPDGGARRGGADRRLQRRDDRAARPLPPAARPVDLRRQPRRRRGRVVRPRPARHPRVDRAPTSTSPATSPASPRPTRRSPPGCAPRSATARTTWSAWSPSAAPGSAPRCCAGSSTPYPSPDGWCPS